MIFFSSQAPGFFIEVAAHDGERRSNTLHLEKFHGWAGLLIEGDSVNLAALKTKQRKAWILPYCVSIRNYTIVAHFVKKQNINGGLLKESNNTNSNATTTVPAAKKSYECFVHSVVFRSRRPGPEEN